MYEVHSHNYVCVYMHMYEVHSHNYVCMCMHMYEVHSHNYECMCMHMYEVHYMIMYVCVCICMYVVCLYVCLPASFATSKFAYFCSSKHMQSPSSWFSYASNC